MANTELSPADNLISTCESCERTASVGSAHCPAKEIGAPQGAMKADANPLCRRGRESS